LHADHINWLDFFPGFNWFENVVSKDLSVFNDTTHLEFLNSVSNVDFLWFVVPDQTFNLSFQNLLGQSVKISFGVFNLNVENDNWLGNWFGFFLLWLWFWLWLNSFSWGWWFTEKIVFIFNNCLLWLFFFSGWFSWFFNPLFHQIVWEAVDEKIPEVSVGVFSDFGEFWNNKISYCQDRRRLEHHQHLEVLLRKGRDVRRGVIRFDQR